MLRDARPTDAQVLAEISVDGWQTAYVGIVPDEVIARQRPERLAEYFASDAASSEGMRTLVVEVRGRIVGFAHTGPLRCEPDEAISGSELWGMYVHSSRRGQGFGRTLMDAAMDHFRNLGHDTAYLWVMRDNSAARRFYEAAGWELDPTAARTEPLPQVRYTIAT